MRLPRVWSSLLKWKIAVFATPVIRTMLAGGGSGGTKGVKELTSI